MFSRSCGSVTSRSRICRKSTYRQPYEAYRRSSRHRQDAGTALGIAHTRLGCAPCSLRCAFLRAAVCKSIRARQTVSFALETFLLMLSGPLLLGEFLKVFGPFGHDHFQNRRLQHRCPCALPIGQINRTGSWGGSKPLCPSEPLGQTLETTGRSAPQRASPPQSMSPRRYSCLKAPDVPRMCLQLARFTSNAAK